MTSNIRTGANLLWATASKTKPGELEMGDLHLVAYFEGGALLAVVDGIGHGVEAASVAREAARVFSEQPTRPVEDLLHLAHGALRETRGAVAAVASIDFNSNLMRWAGVGNVDGMVIRPGESEPVASLIQRAGTLGAHYASLYSSQVVLRKGDVVVLSTDGIQPGYASKIFPRYAPQQIANSILETFFSGLDDGLVLVARYTAGGTT